MNPTIGQPTVTCGCGHDSVSVHCVIHGDKNGGTNGV